MKTINERSEEILAETDFQSGAELLQTLKKLPTALTMCEISSGASFDRTIAEIEDTHPIFETYRNTKILRVMLRTEKHYAYLAGIRSAKVFFSRDVEIIFLQVVD